MLFFVFKQKTAYEMRISDWSSDVCSSDLWLIAVAAGPEAYEAQQWFMGSILGQLILFGLTWALLHHALGGIRHLVLDMGRAHDYPWREYLARASLIGSVALTVLLWIIGYIVW